MRLCPSRCTLDTLDLSFSEAAGQEGPWCDMGSFFFVSVAAKQVRLRDCERCEIRSFVPNKEGLIIEASRSLTIGEWDETTHTFDHQPTGCTTAEPAYRVAHVLLSLLPLEQRWRRNKRRCVRGEAEQHDRRHRRAVREEQRPSGERSGLGKGPAP